MIPPQQLHHYDYFVDEHGNWYCEGNPVLDEQLFRILSRSLFERDGAYFIRCEGEVHPVRVADAPLWVRYVHPRMDGEGCLTGFEIELQDGRRELLAPETLTISHGHALYCLATPRRMHTRFGKIAYYELASFLQEDEETGSFFLVVGDTRYEIREDAA